MKLWTTWPRGVDPYEAQRWRGAPPQPRIVEVREDLWEEGGVDGFDAVNAVWEEAGERASSGDVYLFTVESSSLPALGAWGDSERGAYLIANTPNAMVAFRVRGDSDIDPSTGGAFHDLPISARVLIVEPRKPIDLAKSGVGRWRWGDPTYIGASWVIVRGGEDADGHPIPLHPNWVRSMRDQAKAAGRPFAFLGWGGYAPVEEPRHGDVWALGGGGTQWWKCGDRGSSPGKWDPHGDVLMRPAGDLPVAPLLDGVSHLDCPEICQ